ncbi:winged helix-turn-helix transcriptional regulator [Streptomyces sp. PRB2-1]|uniref:Winged helix-turn-helix transcriptional regulator n=1 Tax=Actinacidiphila epipremni TaxID=2053013 RepID=A0ABX0ZSS1_9ACTN|nr:winged helix-turn-helix transcriptional regulator [Actinacidiphila epipremni]
MLRCRFAYSPAFETLAAVRVATGPQPPGHHARWLAEVAPRLKALDLRPLTLLQPRRGYTPDFLAPPPDGPVDSFAADLARIAATPPAQARAEIARSLAETPGAARTATGRLLLGAEPAEVVRLLAELVRAAWEALVEPYWARTRALLEADVAFQAGRLAAGGLDRLFAELHPSVRWHDGVLTREHGGADHRDLAGEGLVLMPSAFKWDQVVIVLDPPWQPTLIYPARGIGTLWQGAPSDAAAALARLIGRTRARLLTGLTEPAATAWLAHHHGLAPATVSEHLTVLRATGLVTATRHRHEVRYRRTPLGDTLATGPTPGRPDAHA